MTAMTERSRDNARIGDVLGEHLRARGLPEDSGVSLRWVTVRLLGVPITFPNFDARRRIVVHHDVHHLLTGYETTWRGEAEIGAFEIASSCKDKGAAWFFNLGGFLFGLFLAPRRTWRAFVRGRHAANYYHLPAPAIVNRTIGAAKRELGLDRAPPKATWCDAFAFTGWSAFILGSHVVLPIAAVWWLLARVL